MSSGVEVVRIDIRRLRLLVGSRNAAFLKELEVVLEEDGTAEFYDEDEQPFLTPLEAARQIINGSELDPEEGDSYRAALAGICMQAGSPIVRDVYTRAASLIEDAEGALQAAGATEPLSLSQLFFGGPPIALPPGVEPSVGCLEAEEVQRANAQYRGLSLSTTDDDVRSLLKDFGAWLKVAAEAHEGLVGILT